MSKKSEIKELVEVLSSLTECSHCKEKITVKSLYCHHCGTKQKTSENQRQCFCIHCGKKIGVNSSFCSFCGKSQKEIVIPVKPKATEKKIKDKKTKEPEILKCKKCSSENVSVQIVKEKIPAGCGTWVLAIIALLVNIFLGILLLLLALVISLFKTDITTKVCVCQKCGHSWEIR